MKVLAHNLEILLLEHDLVMIPGLGGFLANYNQASMESGNDYVFLPPSRSLLFNKELKSNDGLMVHAYMQYFDATYPQALKQLDLDVSELLDEMDIKGNVILENVGTLYKNIDGCISFEQMHTSVVTPMFFALPPINVMPVLQVEKQQDIQTAIGEIAELPIIHKNEKDNKHRKIWKDIAISSAAAVALFFLFAFPNLNNNNNEKIIAGSNNYENVNSIEVDDNNTLSNDTKTVSEKTNNTEKVVQPQIILLQPQQQNQNALIISQNDLNNASAVNTQDGDFTIVVTAAANELCANAVIEQLNKDNIPGAYYHEGSDGKFIYYSAFKSKHDAINTIKALKNINKRFKKAWVKKIK